MIDTNWRPPTLETDRLRLRPLTDEDAEAVFAYASNANVTRYTVFDAHRTIDDARTFVGPMAQGHYLERVPEPLGIVLKAEATLVGSLGCHWASQPNHCMELGYAIGEPWWNRGIATEAARALLAHTFATYEVERIQAHHMAGNEASGRVMRKLGMTHEGIHRSARLHRGTFVDIYSYAVLRKDWMSRAVS
ncbi:MAG: GNAT family N-acetyltransferase [Gemmataceae bacterium]